MNQEIEETMERVQQQYPQMEKWLNELRAESSCPLVEPIRNTMKHQPHRFKEILQQLMMLIDHLPDYPIRLNDFSRMVLNDTQALEARTTLGLSFLTLLCTLKSPTRVKQATLFPLTEEKKQEIYESVHLIYDDLRDPISVANLYAETFDGYHPMWESAAHTHSVMTLPIRELLDLESIYPAHEKKTVWIVEDSRLFSSLLDEVPNAPLLCTYGKNSIAALECMNKLVDVESTLHFAGEYSPQGIVRVEELLLRYRTKLSPWKMDVQNYIKGIDKQTTITEEEKQELYRYSLDTFSCLKDEMKDQLKKGTQSVNFSEMVSELKYHYQQ